MGKPQPPKPVWSPDEVHPQVAAMQPITPTLRIEDLSPFAEPLAPPMFGALSSDGSEVLCDSCARCWKMDVAGQFKNKKADGSDFILTERFCVFKGSLVTLAERAVKTCSRFKQKKD